LPVAICDTFPPIEITSCCPNKYYCEDFSAKLARTYYENDRPMEMGSAKFYGVFALELPPGKTMSAPPTIYTIDSLGNKTLLYGGTLTDSIFKTGLPCHCGSDSAKTRVEICATFTDNSKCCTTLTIKYKNPCPNDNPKC
jgi:hypothetical protein